MNNLYVSELNKYLRKLDLPFAYIIEDGRMHIIVYTNRQLLLTVNK